MLKEGQVVRLRRELLNEISSLYGYEGESFVDHLSSYLDMDLVIVRIDDFTYELSFVILDDMEKYEVMLFETYFPTSNLMRIGDKDIEVFELQNEIIEI